MNTFYVGQKVVCVDAGDIGPESNGMWGPKETIVEGSIYTIRKVYLFEGHVCVHLEEVQRDSLAQLTWGSDVGYAAERFRPVHERKTDISIFQKLLTPQLEDA